MNKRLSVNNFALAAAITYTVYYLIILVLVLIYGHYMATSEVINANNMHVTFQSLQYSLGLQNIKAITPIAVISFLIFAFIQAYLLGWVFATLYNKFLEKYFTEDRLNENRFNNEKRFNDKLNQ